MKGRISYIVLLLQLVLPGIALATITPPFSTTYNCAEQDQSSPLWITGQNICDGLTRNGSWTTNSGSKEQITTVANYSGGAGGRGQRHWIGDSFDGSANGSNISGGILYSYSSPQQEVWHRFYVRWQAGLRLGGNQAGSPSTYLEEEKVFYYAGGGCGQPGGCHIDVEGNDLRIVVNGTGFGNGGFGWDDIFGGSTRAASDGRWICMEVRMKNETSPGAKNGIFQWWVDGVLRTNRTDVNYANSTGFSAMAFPSNAQATTVTGADMFEDRDDVVIQSTGPIGCLSTPTTPTAPTGFKISSVNVNSSIFVSLALVAPMFGFVLGRCKRDF